MKKGAIFDMDGLLFDTEKLFDIAWDKLGERYHITIPQEFFDMTRGTSGNIMKKNIETFFPNIDAQKMMDGLFAITADLTKTHVPLKPGVMEILQFFHDHHIPMAVASSSPMSMIENNLKVSQMRSYFQVITSGQEVSHAKPAPDVFLLAAKRLGINPEDCYVFEDGIQGVHAGVKAGCTAIMIPDMLQPTEEIRSMPVHIYKDLLEAKQAIEAQII